MAGMMGATSIIFVTNKILLLQHLLDPTTTTILQPSSSPDLLTRHSRRRAGRAMTIISFFTSWITKVTSELSERS